VKSSTEGNTLRRSPSDPRKKWFTFAEKGWRKDWPPPRRKTRKGTISQLGEEGSTGKKPRSSCRQPRRLRGCLMLQGFRMLRRKGGKKISPGQQTKGNDAISQPPRKEERIPDHEKYHNTKEKILDLGLDSQKKGAFHPREDLRERRVISQKGAVAPRKPRKATPPLGEKPSKKLPVPSGR